MGLGTGEASFPCAQCRPIPGDLPREWVGGWPGGQEAECRGGWFLRGLLSMDRDPLQGANRREKTGWGNRPRAGEGMDPKSLVVLLCPVPCNRPS